MNGNARGEKNPKRTLRNSGASVFIRERVLGKNFPPLPASSFLHLRMERLSLNSRRAEIQKIRVGSGLKSETVPATSNEQGVSGLHVSVPRTRSPPRTSCQLHTSNTDVDLTLLFFHLKEHSMKHDRKNTLVKVPTYRSRSRVSDRGGRSTMRNAFGRW